MGESSGATSAPVGRARALWLTIWANRTKVTGYLGVIGGSIQMALLGGEHWPMAVLGAAVAAIGHYNDHANAV